MNQKPYHAIRAWHILTGSQEYYIVNQIEEARFDDAPPDAIYKDFKDVWHTLADCKNESMVDRCNAKILELSQEGIDAVRNNLSDGGTFEQAEKDLSDLGLSDYDVVDAIEKWSEQQ